MSVTSGQSVTVTFTTRHPVTGMGTDADFAPSGIVNVNGLANAATVTVTNLGTGEYKAAVTLPSLSIGDGVDLRISATVGGVADKAIVWRERCDATVNSRSTYAGGAVASITDVSNIVAGGPIVVVNNMVQSDVQMVLQSADAALGLQMAGDKFKADEEFDTNVTSMAANTLTASALASDAVNEIQSGLSTLTAAQVWNALTSSFATAGSVGLLISTNLDAAVSSRMATFTYTAPTAANAAATKFETMIVLDGAVYQYTANALELGPTGEPATGNGDIAVDHDYGGTDELRILETGTGDPMDDALITAFFGGVVNGQTRTGSDGRWIAPLMLDAGSYTLVISKLGQQSQSVELTVTEP